MSGEMDALFADETEQQHIPGPGPWKVLIADDDEEVHAVSRIVLSDFRFDGHKLELLHAYSGEETRALIRDHADIAVVLLDVMMEEEDTGLQVVKYIREELKNFFVRIILRTGQPGQAPETRIIAEYEINDYKEKTELTAQKLFTTITTSLRAYRDLRTIEKSRQGLRQIIAASSRIFEPTSLKHFAAGVLAQLTSLLHFDDDSFYVQSSGFAVSHQDEDYYVVAGTGHFASWADHPMQEVVPEHILQLLQQALRQKQSLFSGNVYVGYFLTENGSENLVYLQGRQTMDLLDKELINIFATNVSAAFDNIYMHQEAEDTQKEVICMLGELVETQSTKLGNHVKRVAAYAHLLAQKAGMDEEAASLLKLASPMHDVGKIAIPPEILQKPGPLTTEEFEVIKQHPLIGHSILNKSERTLLRTAATIALQHHERWDGTGYPNALTGESIHIFARIIQLADVFDALSHRQVYKDAWTLERILELLQQERGRQFDPYLVNLLIENLDELLNIQHNFPD